MPRWNTWEGSFRAAGEGPLGLHYGSNVWTLEAAKDRREALGSHIPRTWIETFVEGSWKRVGDVVHSSEPTPPESV
jgi:hypothetical protein